MTGWADAVAAAHLFAVDPAGTGVCLRAPAGPARDRWLAVLRDALPAGTTLRRVPLSIPDDRLLGGLDLAATLGAGRPIHTRGLLAESEGGVLLLAMAERLGPGTAARLAAAVDGGARFGTVALDEGIDDERPPAALLDRLAFPITLPTADLPSPSAAVAGEGRGEGSLGQMQMIGSFSSTPPVASLTPSHPHPGPLPPPAPFHLLRQRNLEAPPAAGEGEDLFSITASPAIIEALCTTAAALGVHSMRAPILALHAARAAAALAGRREISVEDATLAARLVLAPRATQIPDAGEPEPEPDTEAEPEAGPEPDSTPDPGDSQKPIEDRVLEAAQAAIPPGLLAQLQDQAAARTMKSGVSGALQRSGQRGRAAGVRQGDPRRGLRLNLIETLRAAAPWQTLRRGPGQLRIEVRASDFRVTHLKQRSETTTIFVVDASGSAALNRLAEAKGAVELLLAECYVRRDRVAVLAFRGRGAQMLLPPTRSLVRAKRSLAGLPGGGGTPLAAGIDAGSALAAEVRRRGGTPTLVLLTDGRANVTRAGKGNRALAEEEALAASRALRATGARVLLIDTSPRPYAPNARLAMQMGARYLPLPYADAAALSRTVQANR